jgi:hypothetical protein
MPNIDRTPAGMQMVLPGCEQRTLPKSTTRSDGEGQGLLQFFKATTVKEKLDLLANAPLKAKRTRHKLWREVV